MFNSMILKTVKTSLVAAALMGASVSVQADELISTNLASNIEKNIAAQMQEMINVAQTELSLSLQAQMSEMLFDIENSDSLAAGNVQQGTTEQPLVTSALVKE